MSTLLFSFQHWTYSKSTISKEGINYIVRILVVIAAKLLYEVKRILKKFSLKESHGGVDSTVARFLFNLRNPTEQRHGVLTTDEIREHAHWWIKKDQLWFKNAEQMEEG